MDIILQFDTVNRWESGNIIIDWLEAWCAGEDEDALLRDWPTAILGQQGLISGIWYTCVLLRRPWGRLRDL